MYIFYSIAKTLSFALTSKDKTKKYLFLAVAAIGVFVFFTDESRAQEACGQVGNLVPNFSSTTFSQNWRGVQCSSLTPVHARSGGTGYIYSCTVHNRDITPVCPNVGTPSFGGGHAFSLDNTTVALACLNRAEAGLCDRGTFNPDTQQCEILDEPDCLCSDGHGRDFESRGTCDLAAEDVCSSASSCAEVACSPGAAMCGSGNDVSGINFLDTGLFEIACAPAIETNFCIGDSQTDLGPICIGQGCDFTAEETLGGQAAMPDGSEQCTSDFYTDPVTREVVCGTLVSQNGNGATVSTSTNQDGVVTTTTTSPSVNVDGEEVETTVSTNTFPDGSATTSVTVNNLTTGESETSTSTGSSFGGGVIGGGNDPNCPGNIFVFHAGELVCSTLAPATENTEQNVAGGGDSCSVAPSCSGDQIQCQILYQTWLSRCQVELDPDIQFDVDPEDILTEAGLGPDQPDDFIRTEVDVSDIAFDESGFFAGNGTCPPGIQFQFRDTTYTIPLNAWCELSELLSFIIVALATFVAGRVVLEAF